MRIKNINIQIIALLAGVLMFHSCHDRLDELAENKVIADKTDYTKTEDMNLPLLGMYGKFNDKAWDAHLLLGVRGDDVNSGGLGDQQDYAETDKFNYNQGYWMYNSLWQTEYQDIIAAHSAMEQIEQYKVHAADKSVADRYIAEIKVIRAWTLLHIARTWGDVFIPKTSDPSELLVANLSSKEDVMKHISDQMDEAISILPEIHPNKRTDIRGGATKYTALAVKALANLELKNYQKVADATSEIIKSNKFKLEDDFYELFKIKGKLNDENILEMQYSDLGQGSGDNFAHLFAPYGPENWSAKVADAAGGWGFYEPSIKYIKFMLDRGETTRLQTSVMFTNRGIMELKKDGKYTNLPSWISNTTPSGDVVNDFNRAMFSSGKHYLPSDQLTAGRTDYGTNKNFTCIRYAEILLMHAEAIVQGATSTSLSAVEAVNKVRSRAKLSTLSSVTLDDVMNEKFAELAMEWGTRYHDIVRLEKYNELSYDGRTFTKEKVFLPYPQAQVDQFPVLKNK